MFFRLILSVVLLTGFLFAQENDRDKIIKSEQERYSKNLRTFQNSIPRR